MTLSEFEAYVFAVAVASNVCDIPTIRRLTATFINLRIDLRASGFVDVFYNEHTGTTAFALIRNDQRVFGADNAGDWHVHPFPDPERHVPLQGEMSFAEFVAEIERHDLGETG